MFLLTKQGGILKPFAILLGYIMEGTFWVISKIGICNTGVAIILFTILVYVLMIPLTYKQQKFSKFSAKMNPEIQAIQAKYKGRSDNDSMMKMQQETQMVYEKYGVSPSGSCIQLLIQFPIMIALYRVIYSLPAYVRSIRTIFDGLVTKLIYQDGALDYIQKLSSSAAYKKQFSNDLYGILEKKGGIEYTSNTFIDVLNRANDTDWANLADKFPDLANSIQSTHEQLANINNFCGMNISNSPSFILKQQMALGNDKSILLIIGVILIPLLSALTQWINTKLIPMNNSDNKKGSGSDTADAMMNSMKTMNTIMPIFSAVMCFTLPLGLGIYWISGSVVRSVIQVCINKRIDKMDIDEIIKQNIEKSNEKRAKAGLPQNTISSIANMNTRNVEKKDNKNNISEEEKQAMMKESTDYYNNNNDKDVKPGSLASKALMVKKYNEKNNKK